MGSNSVLILISFLSSDGCSTSGLSVGYTSDSWRFYVYRDVLPVREEGREGGREWCVASIIYIN